MSPANLAALAEQVEASVAPAQADEWETPVPLDAGTVPRFPVDALGPLAEYVGAVAEAIQVPADLPAGLALAVVASTIARKVRVLVRPGYDQPVNLYTLTLLESGNRKSSAVEMVTAPLFAYQADALARAEPEIAAAESRRRIRETERGSLERDAAKLTASTQERDRAQRAALVLARELAEMDTPVRPRLLVKDVTPEEVGNLLAEQGGVLACFSAESEIFGPMMGRYAKDGKANLDVYLNAHSGDPHLVDRRHSHAKPITVMRPALTLGLSIQPAALDSLTRESATEDRGLRARFLYAMPESPLGYRNTEPTPVSDALVAQWADLVRWLCSISQPTNEHVLTLSPDAYRLWHDLENRVEREMRSGGRLAGMTKWASKVCGATARLAAVLHAAGSGFRHREPWSASIEADEMEGAITLADYYTHHALAAFNLMGMDPALAGARTLLDWIKRTGSLTFTKRDAHAAHRATFQLAEQLNAPLAQLEARYWIRPLDAPRKPGRRSERYDVNPCLFGDARE
jgi:hypothetical protein